MSCFIFTGPSLSQDEARGHLEAVYLPPVAEGDVTRALRQKPSAIGIIDGYFERVPSVWHKEILYALSQGIPVYGSASMGALRAAELAPFGMIGIGAVYEAFRDGRLEDDDEVAVIHGPEELGCPVLSEAMVNIRRTLDDAHAAGVISDASRDGLESAAKSLHYPERTYAKVMGMAGESVSAEEIRQFGSWLPAGRVDQKREDAILMLRTMKQHQGKARGFEPPPFHFEHTTLWDQAVRRSHQEASQDPEGRKV